MLQKSFYLFLVISGFAFCYQGNAQITVNFMPSVSGQSIDGLVNGQIMSSSPSYANVMLTIRVREISHSEMLVIKTAPFKIQQGVNAFNRTAFSNARFSFADNSYGNSLRQSGKFMEGEYEYCFEIDVIESKDNSLSKHFEQCFVQNVQPLTPLLLVNPADKDQSCNKRPSFIWQPPMPLSANARFRLILTELKEKQDAIEAISYNAPVINQQEIYTNTLIFPFNAPDLQEGKTYVWQIIMYENKVISKRSELWTFSVKCRESTPSVSDESYREVKDLDDGNFFVANKHLRFYFSNPYQSGELTYSIECLSDAKAVVKNLPKLVLLPGLNKYVLDLTENNSLKENKEYLLKVFLTNNRILRLRFIYKNEQ